MNISKKIYNYSALVFVILVGLHTFFSVQTINSHTIIDYEVTGNMVKYSYVEDQLPDKLHPDEVVEKRTQSSYTVQNPDGSFTLRAYSEAAYHKDVTGVWYYLRYEFAERSDLPLVYRIAETARAAVESPFAEAGDGAARGFDSNAVAVTSWNNAHDESGDNHTDTTVTAQVHADVTFIGDPLFVYRTTIWRTLLPFDTSAIPAGSTISSADLNVYVTSKTNGDNDGNDFVTVIQTSQTTHTGLDNADYSATGATNNPTEGVDSGNRLDITSITTSAYNTFTLNSTGIGWIALSGEASNCSSTNGITCLGLREGHDALDSQINQDTTNQITISTSEETGTSQDPYLEVTYTAPASGIPTGLGSGKIGQGLDFDGVDDYVDIGTAATDVQTVAFWMKVATTTTSMAVLDLNGTAYVELNSSDAVTATGFTSPTVYVDGSSASATMTPGWHHVAITTGTSISASDMDLGRVEGVGYYGGALDDVRTYDHALSSRDITRLYGLGATTRINKTVTSNPTLEDGLEAHWSLDSTNVDISQVTAEARDRSGNAHHGNWVAHATTTAVGRLGQGIDFDRVDDYIDVGNVSTGIKTAAFWVKVATSTSNQKILDFDGTDQIETDGSSNVTATSWPATATVYVDGSSASATLGTGWHHVAVTTSDGTGVNASDFDICRIETEGFCGGVLDDIRLYTRTLSSTEVQRLYQLGATTRVNKTLTSSKTFESDLMGHWTFDGKDLDTSTTTDTVRDRSGNAIHGDAVNF